MMSCCVRDCVSRPQELDGLGVIDLCIFGGFSLEFEVGMACREQTIDRPIAWIDLPDTTTIISCGGFVIPNFQASAESIFFWITIGGLGGGLKLLLRFSRLSQGHGVDVTCQLLVN